MKSNFSAYPTKWGLKGPDTNIDQRRVPNLQTFFARKGKSLSTNSDSENFLPGADVVEHAGRALPLDAAKIDQDYLPAWSQRPVDRAQRLGGELEMMIGIADGENTTWK